MKHQKNRKLGKLDCRIIIRINMILFHQHEFINLVTADMPSNPKASHFISYVEKEQEIF